MLEFRKTKIVCTLGPSTDSENILRQIMLEGMNVARINMSHQTREKQKVRVDLVKKLREELDLPIALLLDTKGPEIRIGRLKKEKIELQSKQKFNLYAKDTLGDENGVSVSYKDLIKEVKVGNKILIDDGLIELKVENFSQDAIECRVINSGVLSSNKSVNIPEVNLSLPFINLKDKRDIKFAIKEGFDFIAASFTRNVNDIRDLKKELHKNDGDHIKIIAKIENSEGLKNIDEILALADGIMVARGDLGVEIPIEDIPIMQKKLIKKACDVGKHVIVATQMLDSMINNPRPTRAESTDIANAVYDGASAIMLSAETASGKYPIQSVKTMAAIAQKTESYIDYKKNFSKMDIPIKSTITSAVSYSTCATAHELNASCIMSATKTGKTAQALSKYKPTCPIIAGTANKTVLRQMNLMFGVTPILIKEKKSVDELSEHLIHSAYKKNYIKKGELIVLTAGIPFGASGATNFLKVKLVGDVLVSGVGLNNHAAKGSLCVCQSEKDLKKNFKNGDIIVIYEVSENVIDLIVNSSGLVVESSGINPQITLAADSYAKPVIIGANGATKILKDNTIVTADAGKGLVFSDNRDF